MTRVDNLPESELQRRVSALTQSITELKATQFAGAANVVTQRYVSGANTDMSALIEYQVTTGYQVTVTAADSTFSNLPFVWHTFLTTVGTPATTGFLLTVDALPPAAGVAVIRFYFMGVSTTGLPETVNYQLTFYGLNIGGFTVSRIL